MAILNDQLEVSCNYRRRRAHSWPPLILQLSRERKEGEYSSRLDESLLVRESVAGALAVEIVVAAVERIKVNAAEALRAAVAELCRPLSAAIGRGHVLVESAETTGLDLFTGLRLEALVSAVLRVVTLEGSWMMCWTCMGCRGRVRVRVLYTRVMLGMGMRVALGLRLGLHVDS
jgi:hypothetical protein